MLTFALPTVLLTLGFSWLAADFLFDRRLARRKARMEEARIELPQTFPVD